MQKRDFNSDRIKELLDEAILSSNLTNLKGYLADHAQLEDGKLNLNLINSFARNIGEVVKNPNPPVEQLEKLLDNWASLTIQTNENELWSCLAAASYGVVGQIRPEWRDDEFRKLTQLVTTDRPFLKSIVEAALAKL